MIKYCWTDCFCRDDPHVAGEITYEVTMETRRYEEATGHYIERALYEYVDIHPSLLISS